MPESKTVIILITGARGSGKTTVGYLFKEYGFKICTNEDKYLKIESDKSEKARDWVYQQSYEEVIKLSQEGENVTCEFTGTDKRWAKFKELLEKHGSVITIKVDCPTHLTAQRIKNRGWDRHSYSSESEVWDIERKSAYIDFDFRIDNSGSLEMTERQIAEIIKEIGGIYG